MVTYKEYLGGSIFIHLADVSVLVRRDPAQQRGHQATAERAARGWQILKPTLLPVETSSSDTLMATQPSMASQAPISYILVDHYLCNSSGMSRDWKLTTRFPRASHLRHCQHSLVPFPFHQWAGWRLLTGAWRPYTPPGQAAIPWDL